MTRLALTTGCLGLIVFATGSIAGAADRQRQTTGQQAQWHIAGRKPSVRSSRGTSHSRRQYPLGGSSQYSRGSQRHSHHHGATYGGNTYGGYGYGGYNRPSYILPAQNYVFIPGRGFVPVQVNYGYGYGYGF